jgi:DNA-binding NtrC family response regulator
MADEGARRGSFRWQALLQRASEAVFVLDRRRRLLFVNAAWEQLTGVSASRAHGMLCRRPRPVAAGSPVEDVLAHVFTPPPEVLRGAFARTRRSWANGESWWDVEFLPLRQGEPGEGYLILGRVLPLPGAATTRDADAQTALVLPERLMDLRQRWAGSFTLDLLASTRPAMQRLVQQVRLASSVSAPVLLVGERGTGKETIARIIHYQGPHRERSFAALDCRRLPPAVLAGVLFGEAGDGRPGFGALYLKEPACLPRDFQLRLVEVLLNTASSGAAASPRLLAGSSNRPEDDVRTGRLLEELYCGLGTLTLEVPPLRQRLLDLPHLVEEMLTALNGTAERTIVDLTPAAWEVLTHHSWPGNLRELRQVVADAWNRATTEHIDAGDLPAALQLRRQLDQELVRPPQPVPLEERLQQVERRLIQLALHRSHGNHTKAAELLGIYRTRLLRRMKALDMLEGESEAGEEEAAEE